MRVREPPPGVGEDDRALRDELEHLEVELRTTRQALAQVRAGKADSALGELEAQLAQERARLHEVTQQAEGVEQALARRREELASLDGELSSLRARLAPLLPRAKRSLGWPVLIGLLFAVDGLLFFLALSQGWSTVMAVTGLLGFGCVVGVMALMDRKLLR